MSVETPIADGRPGGKAIRRRAALNDFPFADVATPLLQQIYRQRALASEADLKLELKQLLPPQTLKGMDEAVELLTKHLRQQSRILVVSDFDADGATSCALLVRALRSLGHPNVDYIVPNRFEYGYGLTPEIVEFARSKSPQLIITVDNGISSIEGVAAARAQGIEVLITDHHLPGDELPAAQAIVNPNQPGCEFQSKSIAGVGVIFYVMLALRTALRDQGWFAESKLAEPNMAGLLDLVALGTIADVVSLDRNNRILVNEGLRRIRAGRMCAGIAALLAIARRDPAGIISTDLGFAIGPRLNAAGRLDDMSLGIECLLSDDGNAARKMAIELDSLNKDRRQIEADMKQQAFADLDDILPGTATPPPALCVYKEDWHQGVIGILASRVKDKYHRPVIAFADAGEDAEGRPEIKGSARSIPGLHIRDALDRVASSHPGLVSKFGGHAMAAGLSLLKENLDFFSEAFVEAAQEQLQEEDLQASILSDGPVSLADLSLQTVQLLNSQGPWGQGFPEPVFDGEFLVIQSRVVGEKHLKLVVSPLEAGQDFIVDAIAFNADLQGAPAVNDKVQLAYRMAINEFRGNTSLQLMVENL